MAQTTIDRELYKTLKRKAMYYDELEKAIEDIHYEKYSDDRFNQQPCSAGELINIGRAVSQLFGYQL